MAITRRSKRNVGSGIRLLKNITIQKYKKNYIKNVEIIKRVGRIDVISWCDYSGDKDSQSNSPSAAEIVRRSERKFHRDRLRLRGIIAYRKEDRAPRIALIL